MLTLYSQAPLVTRYNFASSAGTFTALTNGSSGPLSGGNLDDGYFNDIPLSFDFWYMGVRYRSLHASTNGWITWGTPISTSPYTNNLTSGVPRPLVAPLWDDLALPAANNFSWQESGTAPNRVMTLQWLNCYWYYLATTSSISLQVRLYETSGRIDFVYRQESGTVVSASASIGITSAGTGAGNFRSLNSTGSNPSVSSTTETASLSTRPSNGRTYSWTSPVPGAPTALTFTGVSSTGMTLNWIDNATNEVGYVVYRSTDGVTYTFWEQVAANSTQAVETGLASNTLYHWRVYAVTEGALSAPVSGQRMTDCQAPQLAQTPVLGLVADYRLAGNGLDETGGNPGTLQGGAVSTADRFGLAGKAVALSGSAQYMSTAVAWSVPSEFSLSLWFRGLQAGRLMGLGAQGTGLSATTNCQLFLDDSGHLCFGVVSGSPRVLQAPGNYLDSLWHLGTATFSPVTGMVLYVDGVAVATNPLVTTASAYSGYLRIGEDNLAGWPLEPSTDYEGSVDDALVYSRALLSTEVATLYNNAEGAGNNGPVCAGETLSLTVTSVPGATYQWTGPNGFSSSVQQPSLVMGAGAVGTYTVVATVSTCSTVAHTLVRPSNEPGLWTGRVSNDWNNGGNWCSGTVPTSSTDVSIQAGAPNMPILANAGHCRDLLVGQGTQLITGTNGSLSIAGNLLNLGTMSNNGVTNFNGNGGLQTISGATAFYILTVTNSAEVSLSQGITVLGDLSILSGTLVTNGQSIEVAGNWSNAGAFIAGTGAVKFSSSVPTTLRQTGTGSFFRLLVDKPGSNLTLNSPVTVTHELTLATGVVNLGGKQLSITRSDSSALVRLNGQLLSEQPDNSGILAWTIGSQSGTYTFPFGTVTGGYIPFTLQRSSGDLGTVSVSSYPTSVDNQPYPVTPTRVTNLFGASGQDNSANAVDRFWEVRSTGLSGVAALTFRAQVSEMGGITHPFAQRYDSVPDTWEAPLAGQSPFANGVVVTGVSEFGTFALTRSSAPFPVVYIGFDAYPRVRDVVVKWSTAMETNSDRFELRRSVDGVNFYRLAVLAASGNSRTRIDYSYTDTLPELGTSYYQLTEVDRDGTAYETEVKEVYFDPSQGVKVLVYPNPTYDGQFRVQVQHGGGQQALVKLADLNGRVLVEELVEVNADPFMYIVDTGASVAAGMYVLQVRYRGGEYSALVEIR